MIVNVVDSMIATPRQAGGGTVNVAWLVGSQLPASLPPNIGVGTIQLMRIIAPHRDLTLLVDLLKRALPSLRRYFAPSGWIELYGKRASNTIGGSLAGDALNTIGGSLRRDGLNTIGGALRGDALNTIGGSLARDLSYAVMGAQCLYFRP
jgi:hypothetical protein